MAPEAYKGSSNQCSFCSGMKTWAMAAAWREVDGPRVLPPEQMVPGAGVRDN